MPKATEELMKKKPQNGAKTLSGISGKLPKKKKPPVDPAHAMTTRG